MYTVIEYEYKVHPNQDWERKKAVIDKEGNKLTFNEFEHVVNTIETDLIESNGGIWDFKVKDYYISYSELEDAPTYHYPDDFNG